MNKPAKELFRIFHALNNKEYQIDSEEGIRRYKIFKQTLNEIKEHNSKPGQTYTVGVTPFSDMTDSEFNGFPQLKSVQKGSSSPTNQVSQTFTPISWVAKGAFNSNMLKLTTSCPSYGYLATAAALEALYFINYGSAPANPFSPQSLLDCGANGCYQFASYTSGYQEVNSFGVYPNNNYAWAGTKGTACQTTNSGVFKPTKWETLINQFNSMMASDAIAVLQRGPYIFNAYFTLPRTFTSGVYTPTGSYASCGSYYYSLLVVGYGINASTGVDYWIVRGFSGNTWGVSGYINIARSDANNSWGITCSYSRPQI